MIALWIGLAFVCGFGVAAFWGFKVLARHEIAKQIDPWVNPPSHEAKRLREAAEKHLRHYVLGRSGDSVNNQEQSHFCGVNALRALCLHDGVIFFNKGIATLPDGSQTELGPLAIELLEVLNETYATLDSASALVTDYATSFNTVEELADSKNDHLRLIAGHGHMYPFQGAILRLTRLLDIDPDKNAVGVGGAALWERISRWRKHKRTVIFTQGFHLDCLHCGYPQNDFQNDPRGRDITCTKCKMAFHVPASAKFLSIDQVSKDHGNHS